MNEPYYAVLTISSPGGGILRDSWSPRATTFLTPTLTSDKTGPTEGFTPLSKTQLPKNHARLTGRLDLPLLMHKNQLKAFYS